MPKRLCSCLYLHEQYNRIAFATKSRSLGSRLHREMARGNHFFRLRLQRSVVENDSMPRAEIHAEFRAAKYATEPLLRI